MDLGAQREISILRLLRDKNSHPNIIEITDLKQKDGILSGEEEHQNGDELMSNMGLVMPLYPHGNLSDAIDSKAITSKKSKVAVAHGILCAVAFLHSNGIIHRDIKGDNIMIHYNDDESDELTPVLIDFSLAKIVEPQVYMAGSPTKATEKIKSFLTNNIGDNETTHTPSMGTPTYKAPEVVSQQPYHLPSDMYSVGVVLLELLMGKTLDATKDKESAKVIREVLGTLPDQPFPNLIKGLLDIDPEMRLTARQALESPLFAKFGLNDEKELERTTFRRIDIRKALPFDDDDEVDDENDPRNDNKGTKNDKYTKSKFPQKRLKIIKRIAHELGSENPYTLQAACVYSQQLSQLEDCDDLSESQALCDCVVLAHQFFEREIWSLQAMEELDSGIFREFDWCSERYVDTEETIFMLMDFCLYPRELLDIAS